MTYILDDDDAVTIGRRAVTVTVTGRGPTGAVVPPDVVRLEALVGDVPVPHPAAQHPQPGRLVLTRVPDPTVPPRWTVVRVAPGQGRSQLPEGMILDLTLRTERSRSADGDVVVMHDVELSGLTARDLVQVRAVDDTRLLVKACGHKPPPPIPPLSQAVRAAARKRLGVERSAQAHDLLVAVDMSASMAPVHADGSVSAVVDVVVGLSQVIGHERRCDVALLAERPVAVQADEPIDLSRRTDDAIRRVGLGCGFRSSPRELRTDGAAIVFVVTDGVPRDVGSIRAARARGENRCLVVVGDGRPSRAARDVPTTMLRPPPNGIDTTTHLLEQPDVLSDLVASLLAAAGKAPR